MRQTNQTLDPKRTGREAARLDAGLRRLVVGQDEAIREIVDIYQMYSTGLNAFGRPIGNLLFLGPTGSGKTRLVEATAEVLLGTSRAVVKIDCGEFQHSHEIAKLVGSPPGYLGHRETHPLLSQETLNQYHSEQTKISLVLFDEIEKASDALWNLLLGILDKATLTLGDNRRVDFTQAIVFMTSNLGAAEMQSALQPRLGFQKAANGAAAPVSALTEQVKSRMERTGVEAARKKFTPEFMNRLDKVVVFKPLGARELESVVQIELRLVQQRIFRTSPERAFAFRASDAARRRLLEEGTDVKYGARHLKRAIERLVVQPLSNLIATDQVRGGDLIRIDCDEEMRFWREAEGLPAHTLEELAGVTVPAGAQAAAQSSVWEAARANNARSSRRV